jgi:hypothetical protein
MEGQVEPHMDKHKDINVWNYDTKYTRNITSDFILQKLEFLVFGAQGVHVDMVGEEHADSTHIELLLYLKVYYVCWGYLQGHIKVRMNYLKQ